MCSECVYTVWWDEWRVFCTAEGCGGASYLWRKGRMSVIFHHVG
jgi:hypothetical protein